MKAIRVRRVILLATALALVFSAAAQAHVTLQPNELPAGEFKQMDIRVPNERDDASTTKVDVQLPDGFYFVSYEPIAGWSIEVINEKLAKPVPSPFGGEKLTEQVDRVVIEADSKASAIAPGQFRNFPLSVLVPGKPGGVLTAKALQTYSSGEVVRWIGPPESEEPAPQVDLISAEQASAAAPAASTDEDDGASKGLGIAALIVGALGLLGAIAALARGRGTAA